MTRIVRNPEILGGKPIMEGTRLSVELILSLLAAGHSMPDIASYYPRLTEEQIRACIAYARDTRRHA